MLLRLCILHAAVLSVFLVGASPFAIALCVVSLWLRIFGLTAGYHRLFSHRAYETSRAFAFALAWLGASSGQRGPLWWASRHRQHHRFSDRDGDPHSPVQGRFFSHLGWLLQPDSLITDEKWVPDWAKHAELRWLNRYQLIAPATWALGCAAIGALASRVAPELHTSAAQCFAWGFVVSTVAGVHLVSAVNSLAHASTLGHRALATQPGDQSRNIWWLALPTLGDAWHNNHHAYPRSARHGLRWFQIDITYAVLRGFAMVGLIWDVRAPQRDDDDDDDDASRM